MDSQKLQKRALGILFNPSHEWRSIAAEHDDIASVYKNYIMPMAAIPAISLFIGLGIVGAPFLGRFGLGIALSSAIYSYVSALIGPMIAAIVIEKLAPRFKSSGSTIDALKLVAYASTAVWVAGVFYILLYLAPLALAGVLYSIYLFYLGLPTMMKTHPDNVVPYMLVSAIVLIVVNSVLSGIRSVLGMPSFGL